MQLKKFIFVTGGVCSSLGKGLTAASIGMLLEKKGFKVAMLKFDPYLNVDPGTMNPFQHGEVYVTDDGAETDLDLGHYYRLTNSPLSRFSNATSGQIYHTVIRRERQGEYLGKTVQVIPHITDEIKTRIRECAQQDPETQIVIIEVGGTVGDIESQPFLEAIRQFQNERADSCLTIHLTYVPFLKAAGELKTKPTQHSVQVLRGIGIFPDFILCRCERPLDQEVKDKIALFCNVPPEAVIDEPDVANSIYEVPTQLHEQKLDHLICHQLKIDNPEINLSEWEKLTARLHEPKSEITVGIVGKYVQHQDAYKSLYEALNHAAAEEGCKIILKCFEADKILESGSLQESIAGCDGYLVPGGYGERGWEGKVRTAQYARENQIPYLGICLGMQVMCVEFARNMCGMENANSTEIDPKTSYPIVSLLEEQQSVSDIGGTMRLGAYFCSLKPKTKAYEIYQSEKIRERHRHRYEFNNRFSNKVEEKGLVISGTLENGNLCEIVENKDHPWMIGVQFHPEFQSKLNKPHPLFCSFIRAMKTYKHERS
ncbi:MAG: CTP synthase [Chlamydiales bacterium]